MTRNFFASALVALTLAAPAQATDLNALTDTERDAFRSEVRAYLLENPEVLMEAISVLEKRQADQQATGDATLISTNADEIFNDDHSWVGGNPNGDVTLVEFTDYRCAYCRKAFDEVEELLKSDDNIRFVLKEFPILGEQSEVSSRLAIATLQIAGDDAYKTIHGQLMKLRGNLSPDSIKKMTQHLGLDSDAIMARMNAPEVDDVIQANRLLAQRLQITGTPTFVLDQQMLRGYVPLAGMKQIVEQVRAN